MDAYRPDNLTVQIAHRGPCDEKPNPVSQAMSNRDFVRRRLALLSQLHHVLHALLPLVIEHDIAVLSNQIPLGVARHRQEFGMNLHHDSFHVHFHVPQVEVLQYGPVFEFAFLKLTKLLNYPLLPFQVILKHRHQT